MKLIAEASTIEEQGNTRTTTAESEIASARLTVSIIGSYNKHLTQMRRLSTECRKLGLEVLIPKYAVRKFSKNRFVYLRGENGTPKELQEKNFRFIERSSFVLVANPRGYIGPSTAMEIGFAIAKSIPVFCTDKPKDFVFRLYTLYGKKISEIKTLLNSHVD
jgi:nucleoside 2-deoxyribosyltransferase